MAFRSNKVSSRGFTLIELMVVVAVIAFVTAASVPSFSGALRQNRQRQAGALIVEAIFNARSLAARTGRCHQVRVFPSAPSVNGGFGGIVAVDASNQFNCSQTTSAANVWTRVTIKAIGQRAADPDGLNAAALEEIVGDDVAITVGSTRVNGVWFPLVNPGGFDAMLFQPTGGLFDLQNRSYAIQIFLSDGSAVVGTNALKYVNVMSGGSVQYGTTQR